MKTTCVPPIVDITSSCAFTS